MLHRSKMFSPRCLRPCKRFHFIFLSGHNVALKMLYYTHYVTAWKCVSAEPAHLFRASA